MSRTSDNKRREGLAEEMLTGAGAAEAEAGPRARPGFSEASLLRIQKRLAEEEAGGAGLRGARRVERRELAMPHRARWAVLIPAATLLLTMLFTTGAFALSLDAAPDSALYGTKLFFEGARLSLTGSTEAKVDYEMKLVEKRVEELENMVARNARRGGPHWEDAYRNNVDRLYGEILKMPEEQREEMLTCASAVLEKHVGAMAALQAEAPEDLAPCIEGARNCGMGAMECMRGQCRQRRGEQPGGNDCAGESGNGGTGGSGSGNGGNDGAGGSGNGGGEDNGKGAPAGSHNGDAT